MSITNLLNDINGEISDIFHQSFVLDTTDARVVPNYDSPGLTFERNNTKRGKELTTCVLYIDIRESTKISNNLKNKKDLLAKIYTSFAKSMITIADNHNGYIRNIIGDRVMVVFAPQNCFTDAINCAITMNSVVWLGDTANIASKLTDIANKTIVETQYTITSKQHQNLSNYLSTRSNPLFKFSPTVNEVLSAEDFAKRIVFSNSEGKLEVKGKLVGTTMKNIINITSRDVTHEYPPILISKKVYEEYKRLNPDASGIKNNWWKALNGSKHFLYDSKFYGSTIYYPLVKSI